MPNQLCVTKFHFNRPYIHNNAEWSLPFYYHFNVQNCVPVQKQRPKLKTGNRLILRAIDTREKRIKFSINFLVNLG